MSQDRSRRGREGGSAGGSSSGGTPGKSTRSSQLGRRAAPAADAGAALPAGVRGTFESSLGTDLGDVRVHTGDDSASAASDLGARAYASGDDIHFAAGQYAPEDPAGQHLLAHEVAHTVQQRGGGGGEVQAKLEISTPGDAGEREADAAADAMVSGSHATVRSGAGPSVQRDTAPAATAGEAWVVPFDEGTVTTKQLAGVGVDHTYTWMEELGECLDVANPAEAQAVYDISSCKSALVDTWKGVKGDKGQGPLSKADAITLKTVGDQCEKTFWRIVGVITTRIDEAAVKIKAQRVVEEDQLAEALHTAFLDGATGSGKAKLDQVKSVFAQISKLNGHLTKVFGWAAKVPGSGVKSAPAFFEKYTKPIDEKVKSVIEVADLLVDFANIGSANAPGLQAANQFRLGVKAIDFTMKFTKAVPIIGDLWSKFYAPALEVGLVAARKLYLAEEKMGRDVALLEWMQQPKVTGVTPTIGKGLVQYFPGGQPVLDVMYPIVNGGNAVMTPAAKSYFMARTDWFDKGTGNGGGLSDCKTDHDVLVWLTWQSDVVWAALYGSMPKSLT